jgi:hypothetical protein
LQVLASHVNGLVNWVQEQKQKQTAPCVLWRQTLPQHFHTQTGIYGESHSVLDQARGKGCCTPLEEAQQGEQKFNDFSDKLMTEAAIRIVPVYRSIAPLYMQHTACSRRGPKNDCSNYNREVYSLVNLLTLSTIEDECGLKKATFDEHGQQLGHEGTLTAGVGHDVPTHEHGQLKLTAANRLRTPKPVAVDDGASSGTGSSGEGHSRNRGGGAEEETESGFMTPFSSQATTEEEAADSWNE